MKTTIWVLTSCLPEIGKPGLPRVFASEAEARAKFDKIMSEEWEFNGPHDDDAVAAIIDARQGCSDGDKWGQWELTSHDLELPNDFSIAAGMQQAIATMVASVRREIEDIESGIEDGLYDDDERNAARLVALKSALNTVAAAHASDTPAPVETDASEDPNHPAEDWRYEVQNDYTRLGYREWVLVRRELDDDRQPARED